MAAGLAASGHGTAAAGALVAGKAAALDYIAFAVGGAESSHGADPRMWRPDPEAPQGPMQVTAAAAADVGGGDRFDPAENRALGRAYLAHLYQRYANWADAVAAYNWGPGRMDAWIGAGRPVNKFPTAVARYRSRVLVGSAGQSDPATPRRFGIVHPPARRALADLRHPSPASIAVEQLYHVLMAQTEGALR
jgi:Transglycosylase SLT domain